MQQATPAKQELEMVEVGPVQIENGIVRYAGNNYPANRILSITLDHNQKLKTGIISGIFWVVGVSYSVDYLETKKDFSFEAAIFFIAFAAAALAYALSKKAYVKMKTTDKSVVIKAPDKNTASQICNAVSEQIARA